MRLGVTRLTFGLKDHNKDKLVWPAHQSRQPLKVQSCPVLPCPPLANSRVSARRSPGWGGGGDGRQVTVSRGGGGICKGISRQIVVPSTDASKENTCEATFTLMLCQCVSSNTNVIEDPKER